MKSQLDERQIQEAARVAGISFYVMYMVCAISIVVQLAAAGHPRNVIGETITLLAGGSVYLIGSVKKGLYTGKSRSLVRILLESTGFSIVFTVFYAFAIQKKAGPEAEISTAVLLFCAGITILCFFTLKLMDFMTERKRRQQEQKYADEE